MRSWLKTLRGIHFIGSLYTTCVSWLTTYLTYADMIGTRECFIADYAGADSKLALWVSNIVAAGDNGLGVSAAWFKVVPSGRGSILVSLDARKNKAAGGFARSGNDPRIKSAGGSVMVKGDDRWWLFIR